MQLIQIIIVSVGAGIIIGILLCMWAVHRGTIAGSAGDDQRPAGKLSRTYSPIEDDELEDITYNKSGKHYCTACWKVIEDEAHYCNISDCVHR